MDAESVMPRLPLASDQPQEPTVDPGDDIQPHHDRSKLKQTLDHLRAGLSGSPFHLGSVKRSNSTKGSDREENPREKTKPRKKSKKPKSIDSAAASDRDEGEGRAPTKGKRRRNQAGALVRKLGELAGRRGVRGVPPAAPDDGEDGSQSGSARDMDECSSTASTRSSTAQPAEGDASVEGEAPTDGDPASDGVAAEQAVSIVPFAKSSWMRRRSQEMERPVEVASAESTLRRRIAFVSQASAQLSEEGAGEAAEWGAVTRALRSVSRTPPDEAEHTESYDELEEPCAPAPAPASMPAFGDLIADEPPSPPDMGAALSSSHAIAPGGERREHLYKILVIGELGTGKTSIIKRYVHQFFSQHYRATIGVDFALKVLNWDANTIIRLQLWDIAGQERFGNMTRVYYKEAVGAFVVFDVTRVATFDAVVKWKMDLDSKVQLPDGSPIPCVLLANKCDQQKEGIVNTPSKMEEYCREKGFAGWFETSAKENVNIEEAARSLVNKILLNDKLLQSNDGRDNDKFSLEHKIANGQNLASTSSKNCSC